MPKGRRILCLDVGSHSLKMAEFQALRSGGIELMKFGVAALGLDPQSEGDRAAYIATTIRELMGEHGIKPGPTLISVSGQSVFSRFVKLPPVDRDKIYQIILYEAQQNVPFPMDEVVWDYQLIGGGEAGEVDVMLAAIKAEIIEDLTDAVEETGLTADLVDVAPMTLYNCVRYNYEEMQGCTLVVDIGARSTDLIFIEEGRVFIRSVPVAGNATTQQIMREFEVDFADAEEIKRTHAFVSFGPAYESPQSDVADRVSKSVRTVMTRMHAEVTRSINFYRSQQGGSSPSLVLLTGGTSVIPYTDTFLREKLKVDVDYLNPFLNVAVSDGISVDEIGKHAHEMGEVVGLGLRRVLTCPIEINLMPPKVVAERAFRKKQPFLLGAAVGLVLVVAVWCAYFFKLTTLTQARLVKFREEQSLLERYDKELKAAQVQVADEERKIGRVATGAGRRTVWLEMLDAVHGSLPDGMWLTSLASVKSESESRRPAVPAPRRRGPPPPQVVEEEPVITKLELMGLGYVDKVPDAGPIISFRDRLREIPFFTEETQITWSPNPGPEDFTREYKIVAVLKEPMQP